MNIIFTISAIPVISHLKETLQTLSERIKAVLETLSIVNYLMASFLTYTLFIMVIVLPILLFILKLLSSLKAYKLQKYRYLFGKGYTRPLVKLIVLCLMLFVFMDAVVYGSEAINLWIFTLLAFLLNSATTVFICWLIYKAILCGLCLLDIDYVNLVRFLYGNVTSRHWQAVPIYEISSFTLTHWWGNGEPNTHGSSYIAYQLQKKLSVNCLPNTEEEFIHLLYRMMLGRVPAVEEIENHLTCMEHGATRDAIFATFAFSTEYYNITHSFGTIVGTFMFGLGLGDTGVNS